MNTGHVLSAALGDGGRFESSCPAVRDTAAPSQISTRSELRSLSPSRDLDGWPRSTSSVIDRASADDGTTSFVCRAFGGTA
jgi:hypothetical protein